jgi:NADH-quinone oxidoreductase subunit E
MAFELSEEAKKEIEGEIGRYPVKDAAILPIFWIIQNEIGCVDDEAVEYMANLLGFSEARILSVLSFYWMLRGKPAGKYVISVCRNISCYLRGYDNILNHTEGLLKIKAGETTEDGLFTLQHAECLGSCGTAPMMMVNDRYYEDLTNEKVTELIEGWRKEAVTNEK